MCLLSLRCAHSPLCQAVTTLSCCMVIVCLLWHPQAPCSGGLCLILFVASLPGAWETFNKCLLRKSKLYWCECCQEAVPPLSYVLVFMIATATWPRCTVRNEEFDALTMPVCWLKWDKALNSVFEVGPQQRPGISSSFACKNMSVFLAQKTLMCIYIFQKTDMSFYILQLCRTTDASVGQPIKIVDF